jgi:hypothetical protein
MTHRSARVAFCMLAVASLALLLLPTSQATAAGCRDPQFRMEGPFTVSVPTGTHWDQYGNFWLDGTSYDYGIWADNVAGVAAVCLMVEGSHHYSSCWTCPQ